MLQNRAYFPIRTLAERTGVATTTLRAWERRYGLLKPERTPKGHRLYTEEDVQLVMSVVELLSEGCAISEAARQVLSNPREKPEKLSNPAEEDLLGSSLLKDRGNNQWTTYSKRMLDAIEAFNGPRLDAIYNEASSLYPVDLISQKLLEPLLKTLGERWNLRDTGIAEEHFFFAWLRNKLGARLHHATAYAGGNCLLAACLPGHRHEVGLLLFSLAALARGYTVVYLGSDMPLESLSLVVKKSLAKAVVLAGGHEDDPESVLSGLAQLGSQINCPLFVGGQISVDHGESLLEAGALPLGEQFSLALHLVMSKVPVRSG